MPLDMGLRRYRTARSGLASPFRHGEVMKTLLANALLLGLLVHGTAGADDAKKLRLITWADYAPAEVIAQFKQETGIQVEVTLSNNEEIISKLRATGGAGYDLAQPSQDRITGVQREFGIYKPIDLTKIKLEQFQPQFLDIVRKNTTMDGKVFALPYLWGTDR